MEEWREVKGFPAYQVSNLGRLRKKKWHKPVEIHDTKGRPPWAYLDGYKRGVAYIVMAAFGEDRNRGPWEIKYKDGNNHNCSFDNLEWRQKGSDYACGPVNKGAIDDESIVQLWKGIVELAIRDLYYGEHSRSITDDINAEDAKRFFRKAYWFYIGEDPDPLTMKTIARRVATYSAYAREPQKEVPEVQVSLDGYGQPELLTGEFGRARLLRVLPEDWQTETIFS